MSLSLADRQAILALLHQEVVPALGCTEPIAVALTAARAAEALGRTPERLDVAVSANLLKNGMGVMVPGTGEMGLAIAAAAGALGGKSALGLECLASLDPAQADAARAMVAAGAVVVSDVAPNTVVAGVPARVLKDKDGKTAEKTALIDALRAL